MKRYNEMRPALQLAVGLLDNALSHIQRGVRTASGFEEEDAAWLWSFACGIESLRQAADIAELLILVSDTGASE